jgi:ribosomal protein S14
MVETKGEEESKQWRTTKRCEETGEAKALFI